MLLNLCYSLIREKIRQIAEYAIATAAQAAIIYPTHALCPDENSWLDTYADKPPNPANAPANNLHPLLLLNFGNDVKLISDFLFRAFSV